jgi:hypothetical protein
VCGGLLGPATPASGACEHDGQAVSLPLPSEAVGIVPNSTMETETFIVALTQQHVHVSGVAKKKRAGAVRVSKVPSRIKQCSRYRTELRCDAKRPSPRLSLAPSKQFHRNARALTAALQWKTYLAQVVTSLAVDC